MVDFIKKPQNNQQFYKMWNLVDPKQTKIPKKGGIQGTKWKDPHPRKENIHKKGQTTMGTSSSWTLSCHEKHIK